MSSNPQNPAIASTPVPPPQANLPFVDGRGNLSVYGFQFLQLLWASLQGGGGVIDVSVFGSVTPVDASDPMSMLTQAAALRGAPAPIDSASSASLFRVTAPDPMLAMVALAGAATMGIQQFGDPVDWTPIIAGTTAAGAQTYATQIGQLVYGQNVVFATFDVVLSAFDATTAGNLQITGLPYAAAATPAAVRGGWISSFGALTLASGATQLGVTVTPSSSALSLAQSGSAIATVPLSASALSPTSSLIGGILFFR